MPGVTERNKWDAIVSAVDAIMEFYYSRQGNLTNDSTQTLSRR